MIVIETERLIIRHMNLDDGALILEVLNEPSFLRFIGDRGVRDMAGAQNYIRTAALDMYERLGFGFFLVESKADGCGMGFSGLAKRDYLDDVDIGFAFAPRYWHKGYASEAAAALLVYARDQLGLKRVVATTRVDNDSSIKLLEGVGLRFERRFMHADGDRELNLFAIDFH
ncbi:MAG: GNAT family N-acetyltransferase [Pseudomonadota bacterium]